MKKNKKFLLLLSTLPINIYLVYYLGSYYLDSLTKYDSIIAHSMSGISCYNTIYTMLIVDLFPVILGLSLFYLIARMLILLNYKLCKKDIIILDGEKEKLKTSLIIFISILVQTIIVFVLSNSLFGGSYC